MWYVGFVVAVHGESKWETGETDPSEEVTSRVLPNGANFPQASPSGYPGEASILTVGILGSEVSVDIPLAEAGLDSIGSVELRNSISQMLGTDL